MSSDLRHRLIGMRGIGDEPPVEVVDVEIHFPKNGLPG